MEMVHFTSLPTCLYDMMKCSEGALSWFSSSLLSARKIQIFNSNAQLITLNDAEQKAV